MQIKPKVDQINNKRDRSSSNLLHWACRNNNVDAVSQLLKVDGIDLNAISKDNDTPFIDAMIVNLANKLPLRINIPSKTLKVGFCFIMGCFFHLQDQKLLKKG